MKNEIEKKESNELFEKVCLAMRYGEFHADDNDGVCHVSYDHCSYTLHGCWVPKTRDIKITYFYYDEDGTIIKPEKTAKESCFKKAKNVFLDSVSKAKNVFLDIVDPHETFIEVVCKPDDFAGPIMKAEYHGIKRFVLGCLWFKNLKTNNNYQR